MATLARIDVILGLRDNLSSGLNKVGGSLVRAGGILTAGLTGPIVLGFNKIITSASDLNEATSATTTIYGKSAKGIIAWSKTTANAYGVANTAALDAVNVFGQVFKGVGIATDAAGKMSTQLVDSAGDLASFYNAVPSQVLADLQSGIVGQYEPLLKYGIVLNEATVNQKAMAMTGKTLESQLTNQDKIMARHTLIVEGLGDAEGDAARTANGLANVKRRLVARSQDLAAKWGQVLLPIALKFTGALLKLLDKLEDVSPRMQKMALIAATVAAALGPLLIVLGQMAIGLSVLLGPFGLVIAAVSLLGVVFATNMFGARDALMAVVDAVKPFFDAMMAAFRSGTRVSDLVKAFPEPLQGLVRGFLLVADAIGDVVSRYQSGGFRAMLDYLPTALGQIWDGLQSIGGALINLAIDTAVSITGWLWDHRDDIWGGIKAAVGWTVDTFSDAISVAIDGGMSLAGGLASIAADFAGWLKSKLGITSGVALLFGPLPFVASLIYENKQAEIDRLAGDIARAIGPALLSAVTGLATLGADVGGAIVAKIKAIDWPRVITADSFNVGVAVGAALRGAISGAANIVSDVAGALRDLDWSSVPGKVAEGLQAALTGAAAVVAGLAVAIGSFVGGAVTGLIFGPDVDFNTVVEKVRGGVVNAIASAASWDDMLLSKGTELIAGLLIGLTNAWPDIVTFMVNAPSWAFNAMGDVTETLATKGRDLVQGLWTGASERWTTVYTWFGGRAQAAYDGIGDVTKTLVQKGTDLIAGLYSGAIDKWTIGGVYLWLSNRGSAALSALGDLSRTLYYAGTSLMEGLWAGMQAVWESIKGWLSTLNPAEYKGPPARDAVMLVDAGRLIMGGLGRGMADGWRDVERQLSGYAAVMSGDFSTSLALTSPMAAGASGGVTVHGGIHITVPDAGNPQATAEAAFSLFSRELSLTTGVG